MLTEADPISYPNSDPSSIPFTNPSWLLHGPMCLIDRRGHVAVLMPSAAATVHNCTNNEDCWNAFASGDTMKRHKLVLGQGKVEEFRRQLASTRSEVNEKRLAAEGAQRCARVAPTVHHLLVCTSRLLSGASTLQCRAALRGVFDRSAMQAATSSNNGLFNFVESLRGSAANREIEYTVEVLDRKQQYAHQMR